MTTNAVLRSPSGHEGVGRSGGPGGRPPTLRRTARLLLVDPDPIVRFGLRQLLAAEPDVVVVGEAGTVRDALAAADRCPPDLVVLEVELAGGGSGVELARRILERHRGTRVLVLTANRDRQLMMHTMRAGVHGYLRRGVETSEILRAVRTVLRGQSVFDSRGGAHGGAVRAGSDGAAGSGAPDGAPGAAPAAIDPSAVVLELRPAGSTPPREFEGAGLTDRENQVLRLLAVGLSNREIGLRLTISEATVKFHVRNLRDKLDVRRRTEIVYTATRQGIV